MKYVEEYSPKFKRQYERLVKKDPAKAQAVDRLVVDTVEHPRDGVGRPERLKHKIGEVWSRRVDQWNRLVYKIFDDGTILFDSCMGHYGKS